MSGTSTPPPDATTRADASLPESESINAWPDETAEAAFLAESRENGTRPAAAPPAAEPVAAVAAKPLPRLDDLVERIPSEARELLEELFRAKFTTVRRIKPTDLKPT